MNPSSDNSLVISILPLFINFLSVIKTKQKNQCEHSHDFPLIQSNIEVRKQELSALSAAWLSFQPDTIIPFRKLSSVSDNPKHYLNQDFP